MRAHAMIAARNVVAQRKKYSFIAAAMVIAMAIMTLITGAASSMIGAMSDKAARYFSGHVTLLGYDGWDVGLRDSLGVIARLGSAGGALRGAAPRSVSYETEAKLYFNGNSMRQRRLIGVDYPFEKAEFERMRFLAGDASGLARSDGILISAEAARVLRAGPGDDVTLFITTKSGQNNLAVFVVSGVFDESAIFGYASYVDRRALNEAMGVDPDLVTELALFARPGTGSGAAESAVRKRAASWLPLMDPIRSKEELSNSIRANTGYHLPVIAVDAHLKQVRDIIGAFLGVTYVVLVVFLVIIAVGISNTIRILVRERTREIGAMRALGATRPAVAGLFLMETLFLTAASLAAGLALGCLALAGFSAIDLGSIQGAAMFLEKGRVRFQLDTGLLALNAAIITAISLLASTGPALKAARTEPALAMGTGAS